MKKMKNGGFTLVELIIVIVILGILAGVAIPAYSGYVKKANMAADEMLLNAVNTAFAAACIENRVDIYSVTNATLTLNADKTVASVSPYGDQFNVYFTGNESTAFKTTSSIVFDTAAHKFVNPESASVLNLSYGGGSVVINKADAEALKKSTFVDEEKGLSVQQLLNKVDDISAIAAGLQGSSAMSQVLTSPEFLAFAANAMGLEATADIPTFQAKLSEIAGEDGDPQVVLTNGVVLYAAANATELAPSEITALLSNDNSKNQIISDLSSDPGKALSEAALAYGMYMAYAYNSGDSELISTTDDPSAALNALEDPDFKAYMNSEQGQTDLEGYLGALRMVNSSTGDPEAVNTLLNNGFSDPNLGRMLQQAMNHN